MWLNEVKREKAYILKESIFSGCWGLKIYQKNILPEKLPVFSFSSIISCKIIWIILQTILYFFKYILVFELKHAFLTAVIYTNSYIYQNKNWLLIFDKSTWQKKTNESTLKKNVEEIKHQKVG